MAQISFSGSFARRSGQQVLFVTERAVFELCEQGVVLKEYANGLDVRRDILDQMAFAPVIDPNLRKMPACLFRQGRMDCFQA